MEVREMWRGKISSAALLVLLLCTAGCAPAGAAEPFVVIVNADNPVSAVAGDQLSSLFLKKVTQWSGGLPALPVDLAADSPVRDSFSRQVHHKGTSAVKAYWQQMIFSGREVPPPEKGSAREVVAFVSANRGGVGYVPAGTPLGAGVKTVDVKP
jgi:ABC-type phosphate transport system substrate-binding protein